jgi:ATP phosphoribosyltransferase
MTELTLALPKGRMLNEAKEKLTRAGLNCTMISDDSRSLVFESPQDRIRYVTVRPSDVPVYVEHGAADMGLVGKDVLMEGSRDVYELLDLGFGRCRFVLAGPFRENLERMVKSGRRIRVATKFPQITREYLEGKNLQAEIIPLGGAVELAPAVGLADLIVDIVSTGRTLAENHLVVLDDILVSTARLIANRASYRMKADAVRCLTERLDPKPREVKGYANPASS